MFHIVSIMDHKEADERGDGSEAGHWQTRGTKKPDLQQLLADARARDEQRWSVARSERKRKGPIRVDRAGAR